MVDLAYREWIFNIKNEPQAAKDPNNYNKPRWHINEFEQVPRKKKLSALLQKFFFLRQNNNNNNKKNIETNKSKEQMHLRQEKKT